MPIPPSAPRPSGEAIRAVRILSVPKGPGCIVRFLGPLRGMLVHWTRAGSEACLGEEVCNNSLHKLRADFYAYAPVEQWDLAREVWQPDVLEATACLEEILRGRKLRGETWIFKRDGKRKKTSPVGGQFVERVPGDQLPAAFQIEPILKRRYRTETLLLDVPNPLPAKIILPPSTGSAPSMLPEFQQEQPSEQTPEDRQEMREMLREFLSSFRSPPSGNNSETDRRSRDFANQHRSNGRN